MPVPDTKPFREVNPMKKLIGFLAVAALIIAGAQLLRTHKNQPLVSPADQLTLRDGPNDPKAPPINGELPVMTKFKPTSEGMAGGIKGVDQDGKAYQHARNTRNYQGVYMTRHERCTGFLDIFGPGQSFCKGDSISVSFRAINKDGKPVVLGTCFAPPQDGLLKQDSDGCAFQINLMRDAATDQAMAYLTITGGNCSSVGTGKADLASIAGHGFWLLP